MAKKTLTIGAAEFEALVGEWFTQHLNRFTPGQPIYHEIHEALQHLYVKLGIKDATDHASIAVTAAPATPTPAPAVAVSPADKKKPSADA